MHTDAEREDQVCAERFGVRHRRLEPAVAIDALDVRTWAWLVPSLRAMASLQPVIERRVFAGQKPRGRVGGVRW